MFRFVALAWAGSVLIGAQDATSTDELPAIRAVQGDLHVWSATKDKLDPVADLVRLAPTDRIGTRKDKHAILSTNDGSLISLTGVEVGRDRGLALERTRDKLVIKLYKGKIVLETFQTGLRVETPNGVVEGGRSYSIIQVDGGKTKVTAVEGTLTFVNSLGTVTVEGGHESSADRATKPSDPKPADVEKAVGDSGAQTAALNLIKNPGFEDGLKDWTVEQINGKDATTVENGVSHSGRHCVRLEISDRIHGSQPSGWLGLKQGVVLTQGKRYLFRGYVRQELRTGTVKPFFSIEGKGGARWAVDPSEKGWTRIGGIYTANADSAGNRISVEALFESERFEAVVWADDFLLLELK